MSKRFGLLAHLQRTLSSRRGAKRSARSRQFRFESLEARQVLSGISPVAVDDTATTLVGQMVPVDVLANDSDVDLDLDPTSLAIVPTATPGHGSVSIDPTTHRLNYTPVAGYYGADSFRYTVKDTLGNVSNQATVTIDVQARPVANNDTVSIAPETTSVTIDILANDTDADGSIDPATVEIIPAAGTAHGTMTYDSATHKLTYTHTGDDYYGADTFRYTVKDNDGLVSNEATVTVNVKASDHATFADVGEEVAVTLLPDLTDASGNPLKIEITTDPQHGYWSLDGGIVRYTPSEDFVGQDSFGYKIIDSQNNQTSEGTVTITYTDYDRVDLLRKTSQSPSSGDKWYHLETTNPGVLSAEAVFALSGGNVRLTLYELAVGADPESFGASDLVELSVQNRRIDWTVAAAGEHYFLKMSGTNSNVDLRLANVFNRDVAGATVDDPHKMVVYGTDGDDKLEVSPTAVIITDVGEGFSIRYNVNLTATTGVPPQPTPLEFDGGAGVNSVVVTSTSVNGTPGVNDTIDVQRTADTVTVTGLVFSPTFKGVSSVTVNGNGGDDTLTLHGTAAKETFTNQGNPTLEAPDLKIIAIDFDTIQVDTDESTDLANLFGSTGDDNLAASPNKTTFARSDYTVVLTGFKTINVTSNEGSDQDKATLTGSTDNDTFTGDAKNDQAILTCGADDAWKITVTGFDEVAATAVAGGTDTATFIDSSGDDTFTGSPTESSLKQKDAYWFRALSFPAVTVTSSTGGSDTANLEGSSGDETYLFDAKLNEATLKPTAGDSYSIKVAKFAKVTVDGKGGADTATLTDSAGNDTFTVTAKDQKASLAGSGYMTEVVAFATVTAEAKEGGTDKAVLNGTDGDDRFTSDPATKTSTLTANGSYVVKAFDEVTVDALDGSDQIELIDSSGNETLTLKPTAIDFAGSGVTVHAQNFEHTPSQTGFVFAFTAEHSDSDTVVFVDGSGNDQFKAYPDSTKYFANGATDPLYTASGFQIVTFDATASGDDTDQAWIFGSDEAFTQDIFDIWSNKATVTTRDQAGNKSKVEYNFTGLTELTADALDCTDPNAKNHKEADVLTLHDSDGDDTLTLKPGTIDFSGTGFLIHALNFEPSGDAGEFVFDFGTVTSDSDTVHFYDGTGDDPFVFRAGPTWAKSVGPAGRYSTKGFRKVLADATAGGNDTAWLMDSAGNDTFTASPSEAKMEGTLDGSSFTLTASGFDLVRGCSASGSDTAILKGSEGDDIATVASGAELQGGSYTSQAFGFKTVKFEVGSGSDTLRLWDSAGNDTLTVTPEEVTFTRSDCTVTATQFEVIRAHGDLYGDDQDTATLYDTDGKDKVVASPGSVTLTGPSADQPTDGWTNIDFQVDSFSKVTVVSSFGDDEVEFVDSEMNDTLTATPDQVDFSNNEFAVTAKYFKHVKADASTKSGDLDVANLAGSASNDEFAVHGSHVTCTTEVGGYLRLDYNISSFHTVTIDAKQGDDTVNFFGTAKNDTLTAKPSQVDFVTDGYTVTAKNFDHVKAYVDVVEGIEDGATPGGDDVANLYDTTGDDTLTADPDKVQLTGNSADNTTRIDFLAQSFGKVNVFASSAIHEDIANLTGSTGNDTFEGSAEKCKLAGAGYAIEVSKFGQVTVDAAGGYDTATFTDSAGDDTFTAKPDEATLSGQGYLIKVKAFDAVHATSTAGGNDLADFTGSAGNDTFTGKATESTMSVAGCTYTATTFKQVVAHGGGGNDTADLYDYVYNEFLDLKKERATLYGRFKDGKAFSYAVEDFDQVNARQTQGKDSYQREATLDYNFTLFGIWPLQS